MTTVPETKYAKSGNVHIAYQVIGTGAAAYVLNVDAGCRGGGQHLVAEAVAADAIASAARRFSAVPGQFHVGLVVTDDLLGGWTNRYFCEMQYRFGDAKLLKRPFAVANLCTRESWPAGKVPT